MADIIDFNSKKAHLSGIAVCASCHHTWSAVAPVGTIQLQCPACTTMNGIWMNPVGLEPDIKVKTCSCGGQVFFITKEVYHCIKCGLEEPY